MSCRVDGVEVDAYARRRTEARFVLEWLENRGFDLRAYGAARMWKGYRDALAAYYNACLDAYEARGFVNGPTMQRVAVPDKVELPPWLGDERFHAAQRAQLLLKKPDYYSEKGWDAAAPELGVDYVFPKKQGDRWVLYRRVRGKDVVLAECHGDLVEPTAKPRARKSSTPAPTRSKRARPGASAPLQSRDELVAEYDRLAKDALPARAKEQKWPIRFDHCFMRVMLDCAFGRCWYECLDRKRGSAIAQISDADLAAAVAVGRRMEAEGRSAVDELDARSLRLRGKRPKKRS